MSALGGGSSKTSVQLYRDCYRLIKHIAGKSKKAANMQRVVYGEFQKNAAEMDPARIEALKSHAIRGLANYLMMESTAKDARFQASSKAYNERAADSMKVVPPPSEK
jgi:hypothetical protein